MENIMHIKMSKALDYLWSLGGGTTGSIIGFMTLGRLLEVMLMAALGAAIGWSIKFLMDSLRDYLKKKLKK